MHRSNHLSEERDDEHISPGHDGNHDAGTVDPLALFHQQRDGALQIRFVDVSYRQSLIHSVEGLRGCDVVTTGDSESPTMKQALAQYSNRYSKAMVKSLRNALRIIEFFADRIPTADRMQPQPPVFRLGSGVMITSAPDDSTAFQRDGLSVFHSFEMDVGRSCDSHVPSTQRLHIGRAPKASDPPLSRNGDVVYESATVVSGMCLLSKTITSCSLGSEDPSAKLDPALLRPSAATFAEIEYIARLAPAAAEVAALLAARYGPRPTVRVVLDVPAWQYYFSVEERLRDGRCTAAEALAWLEALEQRRRQVAAVYERAVRYELKTRGCPFVPVLQSAATPECRLVADAITSALRAGETPRLESVLRILAEAGSAAWSRFIAVLPARYQINSFKSLGLTFYAYQVVRPALEDTFTPTPSLADKLRAISISDGAAPLLGSGGPSPPPTRAPTAASTPAIAPAAAAAAASPSPPDSITSDYPPPRRLIVGIDDRSERRVYHVAQDILKLASVRGLAPSRPVLTDLYPARRVCVDGGGYLMDADPSPELPRLANEETAGEFVDVRPAGLVARLYGVERAALIQQWFADAGLKC